MALNRRALAMLAGSIEGISEAQKNIETINSNREVLRQKRENFDLQQKMDKLKLEQLGNELDPTMVQLKKEEQKFKTKQASIVFDKTEQELGTKHREEQERLKNNRIQAFIAGQNIGTLEPGDMDFVSGIAKGKTALPGEEGYSEDVFRQTVSQQTGISPQRAAQEQLGVKDRSDLTKDYKNEIIRKMQSGEEITPEEKKLIGTYIDDKDKEKVPTWRQQQVVDSLKEGLKRGKVVIGKEFGEPQTYEIKDLDTAMSALGEAGFGPETFEQELKQYGYEPEVMIQDDKGEYFTIPKKQLEEALKQGYKKVE